MRRCKSKQIHAGCVLFLYHSVYYSATMSYEAEPIISPEEFNICYQLFKDKTKTEPIQLNTLEGKVYMMFRDKSGPLYEKMPSWRQEKIKAQQAESDLAAQFLQVLFLVLQGMTVEEALNLHTDTRCDEECLVGEDFDPSVGETSEEDEE